MKVKFVRRWSLLLVAALTISIFSPAQAFFINTVQAISSPSSPKNIDTGSLINSLVMDEQRGYLYATGSSTNELLFVNKETMGIEKRLAVGSRPTGMELVNNKLYVALSGATAIAVVDVDRKIVESTILTVIQPYRLALDGNILFYAGGNQWSEIYRKDLSSNSDTLIERSIYQPELAVDPDTHVLYAGETGISRYLLNAYSTLNGSKLWSFEPKDGGYPNVLHFNNGDIYYGNKRINPVNQRIISSYLGEALSIDNTYIYTNEFILTKEEEIKVAASNANNSRLIAVTDSQNSVYSISHYSSNITKETFTLNPSQRAIDYQVNDGRITFNRNLTAWTLGKDEKYLYAVSNETSRLLQIDTESFKVVADRYIGSKPTDVDIRDGILYVSLGGSTHLAKIDTHNESQFMAPITELEVGALTTDIAAGIGKVYYTQSGSFGKVSVYDSVYSTYARSYSAPRLTMSPDASKLYIGETQSSGSKLYIMDTATGQVTQETAKGYYSSSKDIILDDNFVYYAGVRFDSTNLNHIYGEYKDTYYSQILAAKGNIVLANHAFYNRDTFNPIFRFPYSVSLGHIKKDGTVIFLATDVGKSAGNESFTLYKFNSFDSFKTEFENGLRPLEAYFLDTNEDPLKINGTLTFKPGLMDDIANSYRVIYYDAFNNPVTSISEDYISKYDRRADGYYEREIYYKTISPEVKKIGIVPVILYDYSPSMYVENSKLLIRLWDNGTYYVDNAVLNDTDPSNAKIGGKVTFTGAPGAITSDYYTLHFADAEGEKMEQIGLPLAAGKLQNEFVIPNGTVIPDGAEMLAVQLVDEEGDEAPGYFLTEIPDRMTLRPKLDQIKVTNAPRAAGSVTVTGLEAGDVVKVYNLQGELYGKNTVATGSSSVVVNNLDLDDFYRLLFVSVTSIGKSESFLVYVLYPSSGGTTPGGGGGTTPGGGGGTLPGGGGGTLPGGGGGTLPGGGGGTLPGGGGGTLPGGVISTAGTTDGFAQVVVAKSASGKKQALVNIDDSLLDAEIKKAGSKLDEIKLKVKEQVDEIQVILTGRHLNKLFTKNENSVIYIESAETGLILPVLLLKSYNIGEIDRVTVKIVESTSSAANKQLSQQAAKSVTPHYDFTILVERANGVTEEINNTNMYIKHIISFDLNNTPIESLAAITINHTNGAISPVPASFHIEGNRVTATIYRKGNSVYAVVSKQISFNDVPSTHYAKAAINAMSSRMVVQGYTNGTFQPNGFVTRAEFAAMLIKALGIVPTAEATNLKDIKKEAWYYDSISSAVQAGLLKGYEDGTFRPNQTITQQEMLVVLYSALGYGGYENKNVGSLERFDTSKGYKEWSEQAVNVLLQEGIINKNEVFEIKADKKSTRAEGIELLYRMIKKLEMI